MTASSWWLFALLFMTPDISVAGYLRDAKTGVALYNVAHTYVLPFALFAYGEISGDALAISLSLIWAAHIGMDRCFGFGLKETTGFKDTHLGRIGF
jgi:hypothetical protein